MGCRHALACGAGARRYRTGGRWTIRQRTMVCGGRPSRPGRAWGHVATSTVARGSLFWYWRLPIGNRRPKLEECIVNRRTFCRDSASAVAGLLIVGHGVGDAKNASVRQPGSPVARRQVLVGG